MRPKRKLLVVVADEARRSVLGFVLQTRGFVVYTAGNLDEAGDALYLHDPDLLLIECERIADRVDIVRFIVDARTACPELRILLSSDELGAANADVFLPVELATAAVVVARLKLMATRKRGPKSPEVHAALALRERMLVPELAA